MADQHRKTFRHDRKLDPWSHVRVWLACGGGWLLLDGLAEDPRWVEEQYVAGWGGTLVSWLAWLTSWLPFSLAEVLLVVLVLYELVRFLEAFAQVGAEKRLWANAGWGGLLHLADLAVVLPFVFVLTWGVSYDRPPASVRFGLQVAPLTSETPEAEIRRLEVQVRQAAREVNQAYRRLHGTKDAEVVTVPRAGLDWDAALEESFSRLAAEGVLHAQAGTPRGPVKRPFGAIALSYAGVSGVYLPYTGEAHVNGAAPAWSQVATAAHEKAHQRMVASEDEATFVGVLALLSSDEPLLRYAGWHTVRRQLQRALVAADPSARTRLGALLDPGPQRDIVAVYDFWDRYQGWTQEAGSAVNDAYLKANGVRDGVLAYGRAADLLRAWLATQEGRSARTTD